MDEKKIKKTYSEDHVVAILEKIQDDFKVFGEKLDGVSQTVNLLVEDMDEVKANIVDIKIEIKDIKSEIKNINGKLDDKVDAKITDDHEKRIFKLEKAAQGV